MTMTKPDHPRHRAPLPATLLVRWGPGYKQFRRSVVPAGMSPEQYARRLANQHGGQVGHNAAGEPIAYTYHSM